ncbi:RDD family protein [Thioflexithrix psekupsensis]|uniref:RDD domain-containing protein n=1 Tax=Thioflexithrix psekupsensis TaxID=1570016 RepID=A0A251XCV9_9GAMM|nr:RDD family protein [Thioflexithrix psekupsensis]OUD16161.1 hypothetical protein TPSD3_00080 [Thioflexithrix psekupsensis]
MIPTVELLDTVRHIETPEGVELELRLAGPMVRALAWIIDFLIRLGLYLGLGTVLSELGDFGVGLLLILIFVLEWFYPVFFEVYYDGATPGKKRFGIKVLCDNGLPIDWSSSMQRNLLRFVDFLPFFYGFGLMTLLLNRDFKRMGDMTAGTIVVYQNALLPAPNLPLVEPQALAFPLSLSEQRAIIAFAERAPTTLSPERSEELAAIVQPLTGRSGPSGVQVLYQLANGLVGGK